MTKADARQLLKALRPLAGKARFDLRYGTIIKRREWEAFLEEYERLEKVAG